MTEIAPNVIIAGGGPAGLSLASQLAAHEIHSTVIAAGKRPDPLDLDRRLQVFLDAA